MALFAVIKNSVVINIIDAPDLNEATLATGMLCVEYTEDNPAAIGDKFEETPTKTVK